MKASELRIGNFVKKYGIKEEKMLISGRDIGLYECYEPIPLTEEWLIKFGFRSDGGDLFEKNNIALFLTLDGFYKLDGFNTEIKYVHSLQNLYFALTGEELKIQKQDEMNNEEDDKFVESYLNQLKDK